MQINRRRFNMGLAVAALGAPHAGMASNPNSARAAGFWYPAEELPHERTFMQWPVSKTVYDDPYFLEDVQQCIARIANAIAQFEPVVMLADAGHHKKMRKHLSEAVDLWDIPTEDLWCRDSGPSFVINGKGGLAMTSFNFNGWGNKQVHEHDGAIAGKIAQRLGLTMFDSGLVGEAGGVETDGHGTLIAHESSFVNPNRNAADRAAITQMLLDTMGAKKMIWAPGVMDADITDYHIDSLARFVRPGQVLIQKNDAEPAPADPSIHDPWAKAAAETYEILSKATDAEGRAIELVTIPEPQAPRVDSPDFVASYVNYYVCNGAVIAAEFGDRETDAKAAQILAQLYPGRRVVTLNVDALGEIGGGIHCATHEQPKV